MSLNRVQKALARIYTDRKLRDDFLTNPDLVGVSLGLNCQEIQQLGKLSKQQVNLFANSLKRKRLGEVRKLLPLTNKVLGKEFDQLFFGYSETYLPNEIKKHLQDASIFIEYIIQNLNSNNIQSQWILDIMHHERIRLKAISGKQLLIAHSFNYNLNSLINGVRNDSKLVLNLQPSIGIWLKLTPNSQWHSFSIPLPKFLNSQYQTLKTGSFQS